MSEGERITWSNVQGVTVVHLRGDFDLADVDQLREACEAALAEHGSRLVIDLAQTTFLDSSALGALVQVRNETADHGGWLRFAAAESQSVRRVLEITMLGPAFGTYDTVEEAASAPLVEGGQPGDPRAPEAPSAD